MKTTLLKLFFVSTIILCAAFSYIGYASLTDELTGGGTVVVEEQKGVYIYDIDIPGGSDVDVNSYISTVLNSTSTLEGDKKDSNVVKITVKNNSEDVYGYSSTLRQSGIDETTYSNGDIAYAVYADEACTIPLAKKTPVQPDGFLDFYVKFYYTDTANNLNYNYINVYKWIMPSADTDLTKIKEEKD
jgi:hypothetical protein